MNTRVAVVTGGNRGIGLEICRQLAHAGLRVVLTARSPEKGRAAAESVSKEGVAMDFFPLDVSNAAGIHQFGIFMEKEYGRCDVLVNNAGIFPDSGKISALDTDVQILRAAMETNVYGPFMLCQRLVPLMRKNGYGRIVNLSSGMGQLSEMNGGCPGYRISKTGLNAVTRILADELRNDNILINSMCPGWVKTEMGGPDAPRTVEEGADTALWLATLPDDGPRGGFFRNRTPMAW